MAPKLYCKTWDLRLQIWAPSIWRMEEYTTITKVGGSSQVYLNLRNPVVIFVTKIASDAGFQDLELLVIIYIDLKYGAKLGCKGKFREPTKSSNVLSSFEYGERVSDSMCESIKINVCCWTLWTWWDTRRSKNFWTDGQIKTELQRKEYFKSKCPKRLQCERRHQQKRISS